MPSIFDQRYRRMVDFLSLDSVELEEPHIPEKIMFLYDWAEKKAKSEDLDQVLNKLYSFKKDIGSTLRGKPLLTDMYKFARLDAEKIIAKEEKEIASKSAEELAELEKKMISKTEKRIKDWNQTKEKIAQESDEKDLENIFRANTLARMVQSEAKQQSKTNVNYQVAKDDSPKAVKLNPGD